MERVINLFDVNAVQLMEALGRDQKDGIDQVGGYGAVGDRVCDRHRKIFNLISSLTFFIILIFYQFILS